MTSSIGKLAAVTHNLTRGALYVSALGLVLMTLIIGWQVFARYVLNASPAWSEAAALLLMLYYIMLAAAVGVYEGFHLGLKVLLDSLSPVARRYLTIFDNALIFVFGLVMLINSVRLAEFTASHTIPTLNISRAVAYWPFAAAGLLIATFSLERLLLAVARQEE
jgi:TRAP-type C4-dicarboxylate transport system permease small subunit